jgi:hypothetical protein
VSGEEEGDGDLEGLIIFQCLESLSDDIEMK